MQQRKKLLIGQHCDTDYKLLISIEISCRKGAGQWGDLLQRENLGNHMKQK